MFQEVTVNERRARRGTAGRGEFKRLNETATIYGTAGKIKETMRARRRRERWGGGEIREEGRRVTEGGDELENDGEIMNKTDGRRGERQTERERIQLYLASRCLMSSSYMSVVEQNRTRPVCPRRLRFPSAHHVQTQAPFPF